MDAVNENSQQNSLQKNALEWSVFAFSCVQVAGVLGYLIYAASTLGNSPANIEIKVGASSSHGEYFRVPLEIENTGDHTAEGVTMEIALEAGGKEIEKNEFEISFLPRGSKREAEVTFKQNPRQGKIRARVLGYEKP